jgi:glycine/D-amino acid oxidase-like deaminating enzyme
MTEVATRAETGVHPKIEIFDVAIIGAGISGVGGAYHLTKQMPRNDVCCARNAGKLRRHVVDPPLSGHPV